MQKALIFASILALGIGLAACSKNEKPAPQTTAPTEDPVIRGEYLVNILGCHDCHSPKRLGPQGPELIPELMLSGYPSNRPTAKIPLDALAQGWALFNADLTQGVGPWGASFAGNLTSHDSGIGAWTLEQFKRALTQGKYKGMADGRTLLPPMPWMNYKNMKDEDVNAIFQYLKSTKPVANVVPAPIPPNELK
jgi:hypothetical protein